MTEQPPPMPCSGCASDADRLESFLEGDDLAFETLG